MNSLYIDTHDVKIIFALFNQGKLIDYTEYASPNNHSSYIMPELKKILDKNKLDIHDINEIIVVNGPGSFTGVRLGVTIAKTLAYTLNIPIKTIDSLVIQILSSNYNGEVLATLKDTKGYYYGLYDSNKNIIGEICYRDKDSFFSYMSTNKLEDKIISETKYNYNAIYEYSKNLNPINPHSVNPFYVKIIEALKND